jgi:hypothetical protein
MLLPAVTGPDDTQFIFTILCFITGWTGTEYWQNMYWDIPYLGIGKVKATNIFVCFLLMFEIPQVMVQFYTSIVNSWHNDHLKKRWNTKLFIC